MKDINGINSINGINGIIINIDINDNLSEINFREYNDSIKSIDITIK